MKTKMKKEEPEEDETLFQLVNLEPGDKIISVVVLPKLKKVKKAKIKNNENKQN